MGDIWRQHRSGESIVEAAQREVSEETGYSSNEHEVVYSFFPMAGIANQVFHIVRCRATTHTDDFDQNEVRSIRWFSRQEIEQMLRDNVIRDGFTLVRLLFYLRPAKATHLTFNETRYKLSA